MIDAVRLGTEPSSNRSMSWAMYAKYWLSWPGTFSTLYALAWYCLKLVSRSVHTTVQVAVEDSPATAAAASMGSTPGWGVMRWTDRMSRSEERRVGKECRS